MPRLRHIARLIAAAAGLLLIGTGCLDSGMIVDLQPDGSGTVTVRTCIHPQYAAMLEQANGPQLYAEADLQQAARDMHARLVSVKRISRANDWQGWVATYAFDDINALVLPVAAPLAAAAADELPLPRVERYTFHLSAAEGRQRLLITPELAPGSADAPAITPEALADLRARFTPLAPLLQDAHARVELRVAAPARDQDAAPALPGEPGRIVLSELRLAPLLGPAAATDLTTAGAGAAIPGYHAQLQPCTLTFD